MNIYIVKPLFNLSWVRKAFVEHRLPKIKECILLTSGLIFETELDESELVEYISPMLQGEIIVERIQEVPR